MKNKSLLMSISAFTTLAVVILFYKYTFLCLLLMIAVSGFMVFIDSNKKTFKFFILVGLSGALAESVAIYFGAWQYQNDFIIGVPLYLPFVWGNAGIFIKYVANKIT